jgi:arylamine N-acetyltransferase
MITDDDINAYLGRLGLQREPPSVDALFRLHRAQLEHVPYETTWIHMGHRFGTDREESLRRIAHRQTGGYCFQLNGALSLLLQTFGYDVTLHIGGVHGPDGPVTEAMTNHLVLLVHGLPSDENPDGRWYLDAGLGDALHEPLPLMPGTYQQGPFQFGLAVSDSHIADWGFQHHALGSFSGMVFEARPTTMDSFAARNVFLSTSPESGFVKLLTVQRRDANGVDIVRGQVLRRVESTVTSERTLFTRSEWFDALADIFELPMKGIAADELDHLWKRVNATHQAWLAEQAADT